MSFTEKDIQDLWDSRKYADLTSTFRHFEKAILDKALTGYKEWEASINPYVATCEECWQAARLSAWKEALEKIPSVSVADPFLSKIQMENRKLKLALQFYGDRKNWEDLRTKEWDHYQAKILDDNGDIARAALEGTL